jgi:hypothetical protein
MEFVDMQDFYYYGNTIFTNATLGSLGLCYQQITALRSFMSKQRDSIQKKSYGVHIA